MTQELKQKWAIIKAVEAINEGLDIILDKGEIETFKEADRKGVALALDISYGAFKDVQYEARLALIDAGLGHGDIPQIAFPNTERWDLTSIALSSMWKSVGPESFNKMVVERPQDRKGLSLGFALVQGLIEMRSKELDEHIKNNKH